MIRPASPADAGAISEVLIAAASPLRKTDFTDTGWQLLLNANTVEATAQRITAPNYLVVCYERNDDIVGFISIKDQEKIEHMFVLTEYQGQQIGSQLWQTAKQSCIEQGNNGYFWVRSSSYAEPIYQSFGFTAVGKRKTESGITSQLMELNIG